MRHRSRSVGGGGRASGRIAADSLVVAAGTGVSQVFTALAFVVAARQVTPGEFGYVAAALSLVPVLTQALDWGSQAILTRRLSAGSVDAGHYRGWMVRRAAVFGLASIACVGVAAALNVSLVVGLGCGLYLWALGLVQPARVWPQVERRFGWMALGKVVGRATTLGVTVLPALALSGVSTATVLPLAMAIGSLAESAFLSRTWPRSPAAHVPLVQLWQGSGQVGLASMLGMAQQMDTAIVAVVAGPAQAGIYGAVSRWVAPLMLPSLAIGEVLYPRFAATRAPGAIRSAVAGSLPALLLSVLGAVVAAVAARPLTGLLLGPAYAESADVLALLAIGTIPLMIAAPLFSFLVARGHDRPALISRGLGSGAALLGLPILASIGGAPAAAVGIGLGNLLFLGSCAAFATGALSRNDEASDDHDRLE